MNTVSPAVPQPRIVMFGIDCHFTNTVRDELTARDLAPVALLLSGHPAVEQPIRANPPARSLPIAGQQPLPVNTPLFRVGRLTSGPTIDLVRSLEPDILVVACFPRLIPAALTSVASLAVNIHPSLLPEHRGPDPLFWIMRDGGARSGVTVHQLSAQFDAGRILSQQAVSYPDGARETQVENLLARTGARMLAEVARAFTDNTLHASTQEGHLSSYETWPTDDDYSISTDRSVRHAWNFIRGVAKRGVPIRIDTGHCFILVSDATEFGHEDPLPTQTAEGPVVSFADGWLRVIQAPKHLTSQ